MREGEFVDIEVDSGAQVSCPPANIEADTCACVEVITLRRVAENCMSSWACEVML